VAGRRRDDQRVDGAEGRCRAAGAGGVTLTVGLMKKTLLRAGMIGGFAVLMPSFGAAQQAGATTPPPTEGEGEDLAKKLSNPISNLVSVPFQFNWEQNVGPGEQTRFVLNVQPVMPFAVNPEWNMIARVIVPLVSQPALVDGSAPAFGASDILASFFFSPSRPSSFTWGVGPVISLPSTGEPTLGTGKWSAGPTAVVLKQTGPWTAGALWNQLWSFSGDTNRGDVSQMFFQPFLAYTGKNHVTYTFQSEMTANWKADDDKWSVPLNVTVSKLSTFGVFPASYQIGFGAFAAHPEVGPSWKVRSAIVILLPRRR
jgi:hypothetical protein